jgi:hypothetical protein
MDFALFLFFWQFLSAGFLEGSTSKVNSGWYITSLCNCKRDIGNEAESLAVAARSGKHFTSSEPAFICKAFLRPEIHFLSPARVLSLCSTGSDGCASAAGGIIYHPI